MHLPQYLSWHIHYIQISAPSISYLPGRHVLKNGVEFHILNVLIRVRRSWNVCD